MARLSRRRRRPSSSPDPSGTSAAGPWRRPWSWRFGLAILLLGAAGLWWRSSGFERHESPLSVLLVTVDTLRADAVGAYGNRRALTPWMDGLAREGVRFENAHAHNVVTLPSHANILSGRHPFDHGMRDNAGFRLPSGVPTLATVLKARGYATGAFVSAFPLDSRFGLDRGFDVYDDGFAEAETRPAFLVQERRGTETVALARRWLAAQATRPSFCWVHVYEPHFPYEPPEPFASRFRGDPYHGEVAAADAALGPLLEPILAQGRAGRTMVVLTSDHGESLGEHGEATHGIFAYEATLRVPLVVYQPRLWKPRVVNAPVRHVDILPTVLDALSVGAPDALAGRSLVSVAAGGSGDAATTTYFEALAGSLNRGWAPLRGVIREGTKYVDLPVPELYALDRDPGESRNLAGAQPERVVALRSALGGFGSAPDGTLRPPEAADTRERLQSLGYVTSSTPAPASYGPDDDPKRLIALDALLQDVVARYRAGDLPGALERCRELVRRRPGMEVSLLYLAHLERAAGDLTAAVEALRKALALAPGDTTAAALLGTYLTQAGKATEAADLLERYAGGGAPDVDVLRARGLALAKAGRTPEALAALARVREVDPSNALVRVDEGTVHLMAGDRGRARQAFELALAMSPDLARAHSSLAMMAGEQGQVEESLAHWRKAVAVDEREYDKLESLGALLWQRGRVGEARTYLEMFVESAPRPLYEREIERVRGRLGSRPPAG